MNIKNYLSYEVKKGEDAIKLLIPSGITWGDAVAGANDIFHMVVEAMKQAQNTANENAKEMDKGEGNGQQ